MGKRLKEIYLSLPVFVALKYKIVAIFSLKKRLAYL